MLDREQIFKLLYERHAWQRRIARATFPLWQQLGFHVVGDHFYDPIPNTKDVKANYDADPRELPGLGVDWQALSDPTGAVMSLHLRDYLQDRDKFGYREFNYYFYGIDALFYYAFLRERKPKRIIEIGQGFSTRIALAAAARIAALGDTSPEIVSIDPYARFQPTVSSGIRFSVIKQGLQAVGCELPAMLQSGDLLFVDSTHVFKFASDVQLLLEKIYPALCAGVLIHIHDIFTPYDYPSEWMLKRRQFWNEQYFLESFLSYNRQFRIEAALHYLVRQGAAERLLTQQGCGPDIIRREGASIYLSRVC